MGATDTVEVSGHIIDSLILAKILDEIVEFGADYRIVDMDVGKGPADVSRARIEVTAPDEYALADLLSRLHPHGAHPMVEADADLVSATMEGVLPPGFYSTTNLPTAVKVDGHWVDVENPEMDCGLVVSDDRSRARTVPMHRVELGDLVVVGTEGVRVRPLERPKGRSTRSSSWVRMCPPRNPRRFWWRRWPSASAGPGRGADGCWPCADRP